MPVCHVLQGCCSPGCCSRQHSPCPQLPRDPPAAARAHSVSSRASAPCVRLCFWRGEGHSLFPQGTDRNLCHFFLPCGSPNCWWGLCVPAPSPLADGAGISESAGEQGGPCRCFDTGGCELQAELPDKCSDQEKCLYLTRIHALHTELNSWNIPQALGGSQRLWCLRGCWDNPSPGEAGKRDVS